MIVLGLKQSLLLGPRARALLIVLPQRTVAVQRTVADAELLSLLRRPLRFFFNTGAGAAAVVLAPVVSGPRCCGGAQPRPPFENRRHCLVN